MSYGGGLVLSEVQSPVLSKGSLETCKSQRQKDGYINNGVFHRMEVENHLPSEAVSGADTCETAR